MYVEGSNMIVAIENLRKKWLVITRLALPLKASLTVYFNFSRIIYFLNLGENAERK